MFNKTSKVLSKVYMNIFTSGKVLLKLNKIRMREEIDSSFDIDQI